MTAQMNPTFYRLDDPEESGRHLASCETKHLPIRCPVDEGHRRARRRDEKLSILLPRLKVRDIVWTWYKDCLLTDRVRDIFEQEAFTGFVTEPTDVRYKRPKSEAAPRLWQLKVRGWGGLAPESSGIRRVEFCEPCKWVRYSGLTHPENLIDMGQWDGSDFFMVWPLPTYIFVSERVASCIRKNRLSGVALTPSTQLETTTGTSSIDGYTPGPLSAAMPLDRAQMLGEKSGIQEI